MNKKEKKQLIREYTIKMILDTILVVMTISFIIYVLLI